ncbi:arabinogalactan endo-1,4-beta-galactosidase [bacterium]|nr:arabinogalactan endo-1,4-beta-galactosidase [bacterium]
MAQMRRIFITGAIIVLAGLLLAGCASADSPEFYFGVDLSYVNEMDDCGAVYRENGEVKDAFELFSEYGANLVRARLWVEPDWTDYSTPADVERTFSRAKAAGMDTLLDFHYSDNWADPGNQDIPEIWKDLSEEELVEQIYDYTYETLMDLAEKDLVPAFVQVGNETNAGLLKDITEQDWPRDARLFNAGIQAVRDASEEIRSDIQIILHVAQPENADWWFTEASENGITDYDVIGLSYYPQWSAFPVTDVGPHTRFLQEKFDKDVMIVETAYPWTTDAVDETADNILYQGIGDYPISIEGQRQFMIDLTQSLISNGALGVVYWEPAWVSTDCSTRWGQGSHWENATFFDFTNDNEIHDGIEFLNHDYFIPAEPIVGDLDEAFGQPLAEDDAGDNLEQVPHLDLLGLYAKAEDGALYLGLEIAGDPSADDWGSYTFYLDTTEDSRGADIDVDKHPISVIDPNKPEYLLVVSPDERKGTVSGSFEFYHWNGGEWKPAAMTGGAALRFGTPTSIEVAIPLALVGSPEFVNIGVVSIGRGRVHTAGDIMGTAESPGEWHEAVTLENFYKFIVP